MLDDDEPAPENEGPRDHDAVNHEDVGTWDRATGVEALERLGALIMTNAQVKNMTVAQHERGMGMLTLLGSARNANLTDAASIMRAYGSDPRMDANALIAAAENSKALVDLLGRQVRWENELENYMRRHELTEYEDGTDSQKEFMDKLMRKRANESAIHREICPAVVEIVRLCNAWTPAMHSMQERRCALPKRLDEGQKQLQALAKSMETKTCLGAGVVPGLAKREAMRLASYPEWIVFYNEQMAAQIAAIAAALIADPEATPRAPEVTTTIAKEWLRGRFLDTEAGRCGPKVWRLMVKTYTGKFYDFDALDPKRTNKHGEPMKLWSLEHIDPSAEAIAHTDRSSVQNLITNNAHSFGVLPDVLNNSDIMKDGSESLIKLAFWGTFSVNQAKREKQARCKGVMRAATIEFARQIQDGNLAYEPASFEAKDPAKVRTFMEDRSKRQVNLTAAAQQSDIKAMMQNMAKRAAAAAEEPAAKRSKPDAEADDASSAHTSDTIDEDEAEEQAAAPSAKALGKRPAAAAPAPAPAAASSSAAAAVLVWELETKTEEEYNDTKTKLGVEKVCNQKYRAKGSDAPFVLCEMTTGLGKNSTCRPCEKRAGKPSHGRCPATALLPGGHASGQKHKKTAKYKTTEWTGYCCNQDCADAMAKVLYKRQHEDVPYPEGFEWPPKKEDDEDDDDEAAAPVKVPGNQNGPILKPDGSVPVAGEEWAVKADGSLGVFVKGKVKDDSKQFRVCASGQACKAPGRIKVMNVTSGKGNAECDTCQRATPGNKHGHGNHGYGCTFPGCTSGLRPMGHMPGYRFCGSAGGGKQNKPATGCIKRALDYEKEHGKKPDGMTWPEFLGVPESAGAAAKRKRAE